MVYMKYNKLVRDKIISIIQESGENPTFHMADDGEYWQKLKEKLTEETNEFFADESEEELADIFEVLYAIIAHKGFDKAAVEKIRQKKFAERGGFKDKIILDEA